MVQSLACAVRGVAAPTVPGAAGAEAEAGAEGGRGKQRLCPACHEPQQDGHAEAEGEETVPEIELHGEEQDGGGGPRRGAEGAGQTQCSECEAANVQREQQPHREPFGEHRERRSQQCQRQDVDLGHELDVIERCDCGVVTMQQELCLGDMLRQVDERQERRGREWQPLKQRRHRNREPCLHASRRT